MRYLSKVYHLAIVSYYIIPSNLNCSPSPCDRLSLPRTTMGTPPASAQEAFENSPFSATDLPSFTCLDSCVLGRLLAAIFNLAFRKSLSTITRHTVIARISTTRRTVAPYGFGCLRGYNSLASLIIHRLGHVGEGTRSAHRCELASSCSSTFQYYSLEMFLGVMASPHIPLSAGSVTLPVRDKSPPLRLEPHYSLRRRHRQPPADPRRCAHRRLQGQGLPGGELRPIHHHDAGNARVYPALPDACAAQGPAARPRLADRS